MSNLNRRTNGEAKGKKLTYSGVLEAVGEADGRQARDERDNEREHGKGAHGRVHGESVVLAESERLEFVELGRVLDLLDGCDHQVERKDGHDQRGYAKGLDL